MRRNSKRTTNNRFSKSEHETKDGRIRAKKHLGQHFLKDENIAKKISETLTLQGYDQVLEIGPGMGVLTKYLLHQKVELTAMELDTDAIRYLQTIFISEHANLIENTKGFKVIEADFLKFDLQTLFSGKAFAITGNFPYNISSQIVFKMLEHRHRIPEFTGMFQKEVAKRICEKKGSKTYGILSVLVQAFYEAEYLFTVHPEVFDPPPKVQSGVLRLKRKNSYQLECDEALFFKVVKNAFGQRRKTLRNSLKAFDLTDEIKSKDIFDQRPEQLSVASFIKLTELIA